MLEESRHLPVRLTARILKASMIISKISRKLEVQLKSHSSYTVLLLDTCLPGMTGAEYYQSTNHKLYPFVSPLTLNKIIHLHHLKLTVVVTSKWLVTDCI